MNNVCKIHKSATDQLPGSITVTASALLPTQYGQFRMTSFRSKESGEPHLAFTLGFEDATGANDKAPLVRLHSECITGDVFKSIKCECGDQLDLAMKKISQHGRGVLIYLRQEGRGIGIENKIRAYALQEKSLDTIDSNLTLGLPVDARTYEDAAAYLLLLGIPQCELLTNNPDKIQSLKQHGIQVIKRRPLEIAACQDSQNYLDTKRLKMGHLLTS